MFRSTATNARFRATGISGRRTGANERGAALLAALCFATVLTIALGSYISVCYRTLELSTRSLQNTHSINLAETGMEDALWTLNKNDWSAWAISGTTATKSITGFSFGSGITGAINLSITNYDGASGTPTITATGSVTRPNGNTVNRTLTSASARAPLFVNALAATTGMVKLTAASSTSVVDSYDSSVGLYAAQSPGYSAILAAGSTSTDTATVQLTNAQVKGYVTTLSSGPSYSTSATLKGPQTDSSTRVDTARTTTSPYQPIFDIKSVTGAGTNIIPPTTGGTMTLGTAGATVPSIYYCTGINMTGTAKITVQGPVKIVVSGAFYVGVNGGTPSIQVKSSGTMEVSVSGDIGIYGNGIDNESKVPQRVAIYGTHTLTIPDMNTTTDFHGIIYTPYGDFKVWSNNAIYGSIVARNVTFSGTAPSIHYDLNLRNQVFSGIDTPFAISEWRETTNGS